MASTSFRPDIHTHRPMYDADVEHLLDATRENPGAAAFVEVASKAVDIPGLASAILRAPGQSAIIITHRDAAPSQHTQRRLFSETSGWKAASPQVESLQEGTLTQIYVVPVGLAQKSIQYKMGEMTFAQPPVLEPGPNQQAHLVSPLTFVDRGRIPAEIQDPSMQELSQAHPEHAALLRTAHSMLENPSIEGHLINTLGKVITFFARIEGIEAASFQCRLVGAISADGVAPRNFWSFEEGIEPLLHPVLDHTRIFTVHIPQAYCDGTVSYKFFARNPDTREEKWCSGDNTKLSIRDLRLLSVQSVRVEFPPSISAPRHTQPPRSPMKPAIPGFSPTAEDLQRPRGRGMPPHSSSSQSADGYSPHQMSASQSIGPGFQMPHHGGSTPQGGDPSQSCAQQ